MNYHTILQGYKPIEHGDFFLRFQINNRGFVIFSPKSGIVTCLELFDFTELPPLQLAFVLDFNDCELNEVEEYTFEKCCTIEKLLSFLFDVEEAKNVLKTVHVSGWNAYLMYDIRKPGKIKNLFLFNLTTKEYRLGFDNHSCFASLRDTIHSKAVHLCWNPLIFYAIDKGGESDVPAFLFTDSPLMNPYIMKVLNETFLETPSEDRIIAIHADGGHFNALSFVCFYARSFLSEYVAFPTKEKDMVYIETFNWNAIKQANFVASLNKFAFISLKKHFPEIETMDIRPFTCSSFDRKSFIYFQEKPLFLEVFLKQYIALLKLSELHLL